MSSADGAINTSEKRMLTFCISHDSDLVALLIAVSLKLFYGTTPQIHIVRTLNGLQATLSVAPWCGVSTVTERGRKTWMSHNHPSLMRILTPSLIFIDRLQIKPVTGNRFMSPDIPVFSLRLEAFATITSNSANSSAFFYNPAVLASNLRLYLLNSRNVSFSSVPLYTALTQLVQSLPGQVFWVDLMFKCDLLKKRHSLMMIELLLLSHMAHVHYAQSIVTLNLPPSILWLPTFKASIGINAVSEVRCCSHSQGSTVRIEVQHTDSRYYEEEVCLRLDLLHSLGICDKILSSLQTVLRIPSKL